MIGDETNEQPGAEAVVIVLAIAVAADVCTRNQASFVTTKLISIPKFHCHCSQLNGSEIHDFGVFACNSLFVLLTTFQGLVATGNRICRGVRFYSLPVPRSMPPIRDRDLPGRSTG